MPTMERFNGLLTGFGLDDQVSLTELRQSKWLTRLRKFGKLRLVERNEPIGVVVSAEVWREIERSARRLAALEAALEEEEIDRLWGERLGHARAQASEEARKLLERLHDR